MFTTLEDDGSLVLTQEDLRLLRFMFCDQDHVELDLDRVGRRMLNSELEQFQSKLRHMGIKLALKIAVRERGVFNGA